MLEFRPKMQWKKMNLADYPASVPIKHLPTNFEEYLPMAGNVKHIPPQDR